MNNRYNELDNTLQTSIDVLIDCLASCQNEAQNEEIFNEIIKDAFIEINKNHSDYLRDKETKAIDLNSAELNELDYVISTRINLMVNEKYKDKFKYNDDKNQLNILYKIQSKLNDSM